LSFSTQNKIEDYKQYKYGSLDKINQLCVIDFVQTLSKIKAENTVKALILEIF